MSKCLLRKKNKIDVTLTLTQKNKEKGRKMKMIPIETTVRRNEHKPGSSGTSERERSESE